jgi:hypothetical protein
VPRVVAVTIPLMGFFSRRSFCNIFDFLLSITVYSHSYYFSHSHPFTSTYRSEKLIRRFIDIQIALFSLTPLIFSRYRLGTFSVVIEKTSVGRFLLFFCIALFFSFFIKSISVVSRLQKIREGTKVKETCNVPRQFILDS